MFLSTGLTQSSDEAAFLGNLPKDDYGQLQSINAHLEVSLSSWLLSKRLPRTALTLC